VHHQVSPVRAQRLVLGTGFSRKYPRADHQLTEREGLSGRGPRQLTPDQLQLVRTVAEREAGRLDISGKRAELLADAMVGVLAAPAVS